MSRSHGPEQITSIQGVPVAPSLEPALAGLHMRQQLPPVDRRLLWISALALGLGIIVTLVAQALLALIGGITNLCFYGRFSLALSAPSTALLGPATIAIPVIGALIVGFIARYGSPGIRGHGIPEAMEQILTNESRIPARITLLKPLSAAVSIGTGGPFGAEGPIIATGGALGSLVGQWVHVTAQERKTLLAAGAAAGMAAVFGSPLAAVLLALELLLFEFSIRSLLPVTIASGTAAVFRLALVGHVPMFAMPPLPWPTPDAVVAYVLVGALAGLVAVVLTAGVYFTEDLFARLPLDWMWWPALGGIAVGVIGYFSPRTLGVGYGNISDILSARLVLSAALALALLKALSWTVALGSGTSGGTLAPLLMIGAGTGSVLGTLASHMWPQLGIDPRMAALVATGALFAGASRALFMSIVFMIETTWQISGLLPLLAGCTAAWLVSGLLMSDTIMTKKITRRGIRVPTDYRADFLSQSSVKEWATYPAVTLSSGMSVAEAQRWLASEEAARVHQGFPVLDGNGRLHGIITRKDLAIADPKTPLGTVIQHVPQVVYEEDTLRTAMEILAREHIGRLPVLSSTGEVRGIITRSDIIGAYDRMFRETRLEDDRRPAPPNT
ncbi:MAG: chloride channel protein [Acidiferrobacteraceae bacterium]